MPRKNDPYRVIGRRVQHFKFKYGWRTGIIVDFELSPKGIPPHKIQIQFDEGYRSSWKPYPSDKIKLIDKDKENSHDKETIAKIMKLLALGSSPNKYEAELAMQRAYELMQKYDIDIADIKQDEKKYVDNTVPIGGKIYEEHLLVSRLCRDYFKVFSFVDSMPIDKNISYSMMTDKLMDAKCIRFVGKKHHVEISLYVFAFLVYTFRKLYRKQNKIQKVRDKKAFMEGLYIGLNQKLEESHKKVEQEYGIVVVEDADLLKHCHENWNLSDMNRKQRMVDKESYERGVKEGRSIDIHDGIQQGSEKSGTKLLEDRNED